jgi:tRNA modification GTPase
MYVQDTIAALATPVGSGGVAVIRVSGPEAEQIGQTLFRRPCLQKGGGFESHRLFYGQFHDPENGNLIDDGMLVFMKAPKSYTREDVLELHCHGSQQIVQTMLDACLKAGARQAEPGEFTRRAFLNGRIDLAQAEAVMGLISSQSARSAELARSQYQGALSLELTEIRGQLVECLAFTEAYIDFPEDEVDGQVLQSVQKKVGQLVNRLDRLINSYSTGRILSQGVSILLLGPPNAGKSSLLNALLGADRSIVSDVPGTTRDIVDATLMINGLSVRLIDAAGIRAGYSDQIEQEGMQRALQKIPEADLVLLLIDGSRESTVEINGLLKHLDEVSFMLVLTKSDLPLRQELNALKAPHGICSLSALTGDGLDNLKTAIYNHFVLTDQMNSTEAVMISNVRHYNVLLRARQALADFQAGLSADLPLEILSLELRTALTAVGEITGESSTDELLDLIFSSFCIGK